MKFYCISTKRSGHHAMEFWLMYQKPGKHTNYVGKKKIIFGSGYDYQEDKNELYLSLHENTLSKNIRHFESVTAKHMRKNSSIVINNEDKPIYENYKFFPNGSSLKIEDFQIVIMLRDYYNTLASAMPKNFTQKYLEYMKRQWKTIARECLGYTNFITQPKHIMLFNYWFSDKDYRRSICDNMGLEFTDYGLNRVSRHAQGSSFDKTKLDNHAQDMKVNERYLRYKDDPKFLKLTDDEELFELNKELFL